MIGIQVQHKVSEIYIFLSDIFAWRSFSIT